MPKINNASTQLSWPQKITNAAKFIAVPVFAGIGCVGLAVVLPAISLVTTPIFAFKAIPKWINHRKLYNATLLNGQRAPYGRINGQDYTRWDGQATGKPQTKKEKLHELMGLYIHGANQKNDSIDEANNPFKTKEDIQWLRKEIKRREAKDLLDADLKMLRACAKGLIPLLGAIWILTTETGTGGASEFGCRVCRLGGEMGELQHWGWREALKAHEKKTRRKTH